MCCRVINVMISTLRFKGESQKVGVNTTYIKRCGKACTTPTSHLCKPRLRSLGLSTNLASCIFVVG